MLWLSQHQLAISAPSKFEVMAKLMLIIYWRVRSPKNRTSVNKICILTHHLCLRVILSPKLNRSQTLKLKPRRNLLVKKCKRKFFKRKLTKSRSPMLVITLYQMLMPLSQMTPHNISSHFLSLSRRQFLKKKSWRLQSSRWTNQKIPSNGLKLLSVLQTLLLIQPITKVELKRKIRLSKLKMLTWITTNYSTLRHLELTLSKSLSKSFNRRTQSR